MMINKSLKLIAAVCLISYVAFGAYQFTPDEWKNMVVSADKSTISNFSESKEEKVLYVEAPQDFSFTGITILNDLTGEEWQAYRKPAISIFFPKTKKDEIWTVVERGGDLYFYNKNTGKDPCHLEKDFEKLEKKFPFKTKSIKEFKKGDKLYFVQRNDTNPPAHGTQNYFSTKAIINPKESPKKYNVDGYFESKLIINDTPLVIDWTFVDKDGRRATIGDDASSASTTGQPLPGQLTVTVLGSMLYAYMKKRK